LKRVRYASPAPEADILAAEAEIGARLPAAYRAFLAEHGAAVIGSTEVYGLGVPPTGVPHVVWNMRTLANDGFPSAPVLLPISPVGDGSYAAILLRTVGENSAGTVVYWDPDAAGAAAGIGEVAAVDFETWLAERSE
jgi:hypothetical protein